MLRAKKIWSWIIALTVLITGCAMEDQKPADVNSGPIDVVCTTGMIGDAVQSITGDLANVQSLMGAGVDPHLYKATQGDLKKLSSANIIFYNGLHLEGKMGEILEKLSRQKSVIAITDGIDESKLLLFGEDTDAHDPHVWFDVSLWMDAVSHISAKLQELDPKNAEQYKANTEVYLAQLNELHNWVSSEIAQIPEQQRVMITAHDAFQYFGNAYNIEVRGLQGISTVGEYGLQDIARLVNFLTERKIKAVFVESSVPKKSLEAVVEGCTKNGHEIAIGGTLFSDAMGTIGNG